MARRSALEKLLQAEWSALVERAPAPSEAEPLALPPDRRIPLRRTALFAQLEEVRQEWNELRAAAAEHRDRYVNAEWTLRDLLAHLSSWAEEFRREIETVLGGGSFDYAIPHALSVLGPNRWNQEQVERRRDRSLDEILDEFDRETSRLQEIVLQAPEEALHRPAEFPLAPSGDPRALWKGTAALLVLGKCHHDRHHLDSIRKQIAFWAEADR